MTAVVMPVCLCGVRPVQVVRNAEEWAEAVFS
jgi:hypothetical protein